MSDDETRREDARAEQLIKRNIRLGLMGMCRICGDPTKLTHPVFGDWECSYCKRMMDAPGD